MVIHSWEGVRSQPDVCANEPFVALWAVVAAAFAVVPMLLNDLPKWQRMMRWRRTMPRCRYDCLLRCGPG